MANGGMKDQTKMVRELQKAQKDLKKEIVEVEAGDGAVVIQFTGELKVKSVKLDPELIDFEDIEELEHWVQIAVRDGLEAAQNIAAEKMKPLMGGLGSLGLQLDLLNMSQILPEALLDAIDDLGKLPGVGSRTAERYAYYLLKNDPLVAQKIAHSLTNLHNNVKSCPITFALISKDEEVSPLYSDEHRDKTVIAVVEEPLDIIALEKTKQFSGTYHVLGGAISPIDGVGPEQLHLEELTQRIKTDSVKEIIIATNASVEGESTALYLQRFLRDKGFTNLEISRLARGIPAGVDLEYADQITLTHALEGRRSF